MAATNPLPAFEPPAPPYWAVIFTSTRAWDAGRGAFVEQAEYSAMAARMEQAARDIPGYLGMEDSRDARGVGISISYWESEAAIKAWREHLGHQEAQAAGRDRWYQYYSLRIAKVERQYEFTTDRPIAPSD